MKKFSGSGLGGGGGANRPDTYFTDDVVEVVLGLSEGPIKGLKDKSARNFYVGETPLLNVDDSPNFESFDLTVNIGSSQGEEIVPQLGGQSSNNVVGVELAKDTPVVRQGLQTDIDWLEIRLLIQRLAEYTDDGAKARELSLNIEYKRSDSPTWLPAVFYMDFGLQVSELTNGLLVLQRGKFDAPPVNARQQVIYDQTAEPDPSDSEKTLGAGLGHRVWWIDASNNSLVPKYYLADSFHTPSNVTLEGAIAGQQAASFDDPPYIQMLDPNRGTNKRRIYYWTSGTPTGLVGDLWYNLNTQVLLWYNGTSWVETLDADEVYDPAVGGNLVASTGVLKLHEKITSSTVKEVKIKVDRIDVPYDVRVVKLSDDSDDDNSTDVIFESFQEVKAGPFKFPNLSTVHMVGRASDQFSSIPQFSGVYQGRIVKVPSNYDPEARTYSGAWDGTWKFAYTTNPAFIGNDLVMNDRYGMNSTYPVMLDPSDVYEAGVWCDQRREDGQPQFTFNGLIHEPMNVRELATYVFGIFGGRFFDDGNGYARLRIDNDAPAVHLFTKENVKEGVFRYSYTEVEGRKNDYTVTFKNPLLHYKEDRRRVFDQDLIDTYGRSPADFIAVGCNSAAEAVFRARVKLLTDQTETETVSFETAREGLYLEPYDIILIADDAMDDIITGRITGTTGNRTVHLRDNIYLEAAPFAYELVINQDDFAIATLEIDPSCVGVVTKTLTLVEDLPVEGVPDQAVFSIGGNAKPYRVMSLDETPGDEKEGNDRVSVVAIEVNRTKYADAGGADAPDVEIPTYDDDIRPVNNARIVPTTEIRQDRAVQNLLVEWDRHTNRYVRSYIVYHQFNNDGWRLLGEVRDPFIELNDVMQGRHVFSIQAKTFAGQRSPNVYVDIDLRGVARKVPAVVDLELVNESAVVGSIHEFDDVDAIFQWNDGEPNPARSGYQIEILDVGLTTLRSVVVTQPSFIYTLQQMRADATPRQFTVRVYAVDLGGNKSDPETIQVRNPAPMAPAVNATGGSGVIEVNWPTSGVHDYVGSLIWVSETPSINPSLRPADFDLAGNQITLPVDPDETRYIVVALYDTFGKTELNYSAETSASSYPVVDTTPPAVPTGLALSSVVQGDGSVRLIATWNANIEDDLGYYDIEIKEDTGNYVGFQTSTNRREWTVRPGILFTAHVCAVDKMGNRSNFSTPPVTHTSATDTVPPAVPSGLKATGTFKAVWLEWLANTEFDLARYEIYESSTTTAPGAGETSVFQATGTQLVRSDLPAGLTRHYWIRAVDTSGNKSAWSVMKSATTVNIEAVDVNAVIEATAWAGSIEVPKIVATLPALPFEYRKVYNEADGEFYIQRSGSWVRETSVSELVGQVASNQIADSAIVAAKLADAAVTLSKIKVIGAGNAINPDPHIEDASAWSPDPVKVVADGDHGSNVVYSTTRVNQYYNHTKWPIDRTKTYRFEVVARQPSGDRGFYGAWRFWDANGDPLSTAGANWASSSGNYYYPSGVVPGTNWVRYTTTVGPDGERGFPPDAKFMSFGVLWNYETYGSVTGEQQINLVRITEMTRGELLLDGAIDVSKFAAGITPVELVDTLPATGNFDGRQVYLTTDKKLYRFKAGMGWDTSVASTDLSGQLTDGQLAGISASKLVGQVVSNQIAAVAADKITGLLTDDQIADLAATKLTGQITSTQITDDAITTPKLAAGAVTANEIAAGSITTAKMVAGSVTANELATNSVTAIKILAGSVTTAKLDALAVTADKIAAAAIVSDKIGANQVTTTHLSAGSVTTAKLDAGAVTADKLAANSVVAGKVAAGAISTTELAAGSVTTAILAAGAVTADELAANSVTAIKVAAGAITTGKLDALAVTSDKLAANSVIAGKIAANSISATELQAGSVTSVKIVSGAITTDHLQAGAITTAKLAAGAVGADQISAGAIITSKLAVVGRSTAINPDPHFEDDTIWTNPSGGTAPSTVQSQYAPGGSRILLTASPGVVYYHDHKFPIDQNKTYLIEWIAASGGTGGFYGVHRFYNGSGTLLGGGGGSWSYASDNHYYPSNATLGPAYQRFATQIGANTERPLPAGTTQMSLGFLANNGGTGQTNIGMIRVTEVTRGELIVQGAITADKLAASNVVTLSAQIADAIITDAKIVSLSAAKIQAGTVLAGSVTVSGTALSDTTSRAADPAARINAASTKIDPGKITITGSTTLSDWRKGGDETKIDGGAISANTVDANKLTIGQRGIQLLDIQFEHNSPSANVLSWTGGYIVYVNDAGTTTATLISAGQNTWTSGWVYIYWLKGQSTFYATSSYGVAVAADTVLLATYKGGTNLVVHSGRTIIDGSHIKTGTVDAAQIKANAVQASHIASDTIEARHVKSAQINTSHLVVKSSNRAINPDPSMEDVQFWNSPSIKGSVTVSVISTSWSQRGGKALSMTHGNNYWQQAKSPIDPTKKYLLSMRVRSASASSKFYALLNFWDSSGVAITTASGSWGGQANYYYPSAAIINTSASIFQTEIGAGTSYLIPANAATFSIGFLADFDNAGQVNYVDYFEVVPMTGTVEIENGAVTADKVVTDAIETRHLQAESVSLEKLSVTGRNLINDPGLSESQAGWSNPGSWSISTPGGLPYDRGMAMTSTGSLQVMHDAMPIDPAKSYRLTATVWDNRAATSSPGTSYWAVWLFDKDFNQLTLTRYDAVTRAADGTTLFFYPWYGAANGTRSMTTYIAGRDSNPSDLPKSDNVFHVGKFPANARYIKVGFLNYANGGISTALWAGNISVQEADSGKIRAQQIETTDLSAISATLGNVDISSANIGSLTVGSSNIATGALVYADSTTGSVVSVSTSYVTLVTLPGIGSSSATNKKRRITFYCEVAYAGTGASELTGTHNYTFQLLKNGTPVKTQVETFLIIDQGDAGGGGSNKLLRASATVFMRFLDTSSLANGDVYSVRAVKDATPAWNAPLKNINLDVDEFRRAA